MSLPGSAAIPAVHADRLRVAEASGRRAVAMIGTDLRPSRDHHRRSRSRTRCACCSPSAAPPTRSIHLTAIAGRVGVAVSLERLNALSDETPVLVDLKPTGQHYM